MKRGQSSLPDELEPAHAHGDTIAHLRRLEQHPLLLLLALGPRALRVLEQREALLQLAELLLRLLDRRVLRALLPQLVHERALRRDLLRERLDRLLSLSLSCCRGFAGHRPCVLCCVCGVSRCIR